MTRFTLPVGNNSATGIIGRVDGNPITFANLAMEGVAQKSTKSFSPPEDSDLKTTIDLTSVDGPMAAGTPFYFDDAASEWVYKPEGGEVVYTVGYVTTPVAVPGNAGAPATNGIGGGRRRRHRSKKVRKSKKSRKSKKNQKKN
jgi:hypothetical protein